jgi:hypothetical protein
MTFDITSLTYKVISLSSMGLAMAKRYLQYPSIAGVTIEAESYKESLSADVSTNLVMALPEGKDFTTDNIAPRPRTWQITGYIAPISEPSCLSPLIQPSLRIQKAKIEKAFFSRALVPFVTQDHEETLMVTIPSCTFDRRGDVMNRIPISLTIQEIKKLNVSLVSTSSALPPGIALKGTSIAMPRTP